MVDSSRSAYLHGLRDGAPFVVVIVPFAMIFGVVAREAGWTTDQIMAMSVLVIAGASQFTAVQMLSENAPAAIVILTALAVNLRMAMYSASMAPHLGAAPFWQRASIAYLLVDQTYATAIARYTLVPSMGVGSKVAYFFGTATPIIPLWYGFTWVGAVAGAAVPEALALDFAVPVTFIAMIGPMLRDRAQVVAASVAVVASLALAGLPFSLGVLVGAGLAMAAGAAVEVWSGRS
jgi:predicted branched-subunit amino acid permease